MTLRILVVCTGNICRSVVAERALAAELSAHGVEATVRSAGTFGGLPNDPDTVRAAGAAGLDIGNHVSRRLTQELLASDGADLIVALTREHLRDIVALDPATWSRAFTLRELARRVAQVEPGESFVTWRKALLGDRTAAVMMRPDPTDDVSDPHGGPYRAHREMVAEVTSLAKLIAAGIRQATPR